MAGLAAGLEKHAQAHLQSYVHAAAEREPSAGLWKLTSACCAQMSAEILRLHTIELAMLMGSSRGGKAGAVRLACSGARCIEEGSGDGRSAPRRVSLIVGLIHAMQLSLQDHTSSSQANSSLLKLYRVYLLRRLTAVTH